MCGKDTREEFIAAKNIQVSAIKLKSFELTDQ
jgi:hypothetical protein